jgi:hypothetical protein
MVKCLHCFCIAFFAILLLTSFLEASNATSPYVGMWLDDLRNLQIGGKDALWIRMGRAEPPQPHLLQAIIYPSPPPSQMVLVYGPWAGGAEKLDLLAQGLEEGLQPAGWKLAKINFSQLAAERSKAGRILIFPSGVWPAALMQNWGKFASQNDVIIYFGLRSNQTLDYEGRVKRGGVKPELMAAGVPADSSVGGELVLEESGTQVWKIPHTLNEYENVTQVGKEVALYALSQLGGAKESRAKLELGPHDSSAVAMRPQYSHSKEAWIRLILMDKNGKWQRVWDEKILPSSGVVNGPMEANIGSLAAFQIELKPNYPQQESIKYFAFIYAPNQSLHWQHELGEGKLEPGGAWVGAFSYKDWVQGGDWRIDIQDQFGRSYAGALIHIVDYKIERMEPISGVQRLRILRDGQVMMEGEVGLRLAGSSNWTYVKIQNGILSFSSSKGSTPYIELLIDQVKLEYKLELEESPWERAAKIGLPALLIAAIIFLVVRPKSTTKYKIKFLEQPFSIGQPVRLPAAKWVQILQEGVKESGLGNLGEWVLDADEASEILAKHKEGDKLLVVSPEGAQDLLDKLVEAKMLAKWKGWYGPIDGAQKENAEDIIRSRALMRQLHDRLVEAGLTAKAWAGQNDRKGYIDMKNRVWEISKPKKEMQEMIKAFGLKKWKMTYALVFADKEEKDEFLGILNSMAGSYADRVRLSLKTGRLQLVDISEPIRL